MRIHADPLSHLIAAILEAAGCPPDEAARIGTYLVKANLTGHDSHGVIRTPRYVRNLGAGKVRANQKITVLRDTGPLAVVEGNFGFGQTVGPQAVQLGIDKARAGGAAIVALRHAGHLGRIGDFAEMAAEAGLVSMHLVNVSGSQLVAPFGGAERRLATNPLAIGVPRDGEPPIILDFATSLVAEGKVAVAFEGGAALPKDSLIDEQGRMSNDPEAFYGAHQRGTSPQPSLGKGALRAMGEHKGSGLSFMIELLAGALTGSGCAGPGERPMVNGMLSVYLAPEVVDTEHGFAAEVGQFAEFVKSARPLAPSGEVLLPGDPERRREAQRRAEGIELPEETWRQILTVAREVGLDQAAIDAAMS